MSYENHFKDFTHLSELLLIRQNFFYLKAYQKLRVVIILSTLLVKRFIPKLNVPIRVLSRARDRCVLAFVNLLKKCGE